MKLEFLLSRIAMSGVLAAAIGLALNAIPVALFAAASGALVLLIATGDYSRRYDCTAVLVKARRGGETLPLAG